jgi:hypothetical protein
MSRRRDRLRPTARMHDIMTELRIPPTSAIVVALAMLLAAGAAHADAGMIEGRGRVLCAPTTVIACNADRQCSTSKPEAVNLPSFIRVDFKKKNLSSAALQGNGDRSAIDRIDVRDGKVFVQGSEGQRAWSFVIDQHNGAMTGAAADVGSAFVFYGECTLP